MFLIDKSISGLLFAIVSEDDKTYYGYQVSHII